jgi:hypothetical protein
MQRARQQGDDGRCRPGQPLLRSQLPQEGGESWVDDELGMPGMAGQVRALSHACHVCLITDVRRHIGGTCFCS